MKIEKTKPRQADESRVFRLIDTRIWIGNWGICFS